MVSAPRLKYHQSTFDSLGIVVPSVSSRSLQAIAELQRSLKIELPESLHEWYSLEGATRLLRKYEIIDEPAQLDLPDRPLSFGLMGLLEEGFLYLGCTEQAICEFAIELDGSEDPPVLVFCAGADFCWRKIHEHFSNFLAVGAMQCRRPRPNTEC